MKVCAIYKQMVYSIIVFKYLIELLFVKIILTPINIENKT